jgi:hypothetical protein
MNPFYAPDFQSLQMSPMRAALEPTPLYQPRGTGYMGIYSKPRETASPALAPVLEGLSAPFGPSDTGEGARDNPAIAGGTATTQSFRDFALAALAATNPVAATISLLGQMALNPDKAPTNLGLGTLAQSAYDAAFGNPFGGPGGQNVGAVPTLGGVSDYDIQAANDMASVEGAASTMGGMSSSTPGADTLGDTGMYAQGGYVPGKSGGMDDDVPAVIDGKQPARLSSGEFVFDAATVAALGDGNNQAGARKLDGLRKAIRKKAYGHEKQPPQNYSVGDLVRLYDRGR